MRKNENPTVIQKSFPLFLQKSTNKYKSYPVELQHSSVGTTLLRTVLKSEWVNKMTVRPKPIINLKT